MDRACAQDHFLGRIDRDFLASLAVGNTGTAGPFQLQAQHMGMGLDGQVRPVSGRVQIAVDHTPAPAFVLSDLVVAKAGLVIAVVVRVEGLTVLFRREHEGIGNRVALTHLIQMHGAFMPTTVIALGVVFDLFEIGLEGVEIPPPGSAAFPGVVITGLTAHINHAVDQGRAAQALAPRYSYLPAPSVFFGLGLEAPVVTFVSQQLAETGRDRNPETFGFATGLDH